MASALIGALRINFSADTAEFRRNMTDAEKIAERFGRSIGSSIRRNVLAFGAAVAAAAGPAALGLLTKASIETISAQVDLAKRVGASVGAIQTLQETAKLAGASSEALAATLGKLNQRLGEAARTGSGPAFEALQRLGLSAKELSEMDADVRIETLANRMKELGYNTQQYADTLKSLGVRQQEIINLFIEGSDSIEETRQELKDWGVLLSDIDANKVEMAGDAWDKMGVILTGIGNQLAVHLAPLLIAISKYLGETAKQSGGFGNAIDKAVTLGIHLFAFFQKSIYDFRIELDGAIAEILDLFDALAGAPANILAKIFGGKAEDYGFKPINESYGKLKDNLQKPPTQEEWDAWLAELKRKTDEAAAVAAKTRTNMTAGGDGEGTEADEIARQKQAKELAQFQEHLADKLVMLQESLMTERETQLAAYEQSLADLATFQANKLITAEEYANLREQLEKDHAEKLKKIDDDIARQNEINAQKQINQWIDVADNISSALGSLFGDSKAWAIAEAIISTATAITKALAFYGPTPQGFAAAAAAAAAGAAQLATIRKTSSSKGGGGGNPKAPTASSSTSTTNAPSQAPGVAAGQTLTINGLTNDQLLSGAMVRELAQKLIDFQRDGGRIILGSA